MASFIYQWVDFIWVPLGLFVATKEQRWVVLAFILTCLLTLRMQIELMEETGFSTGFTGFFESSAHTRGMVTYSILIMLYLILIHFSKNTRKIVLFAASISIYIFSFILSLVVMMV
jgi:hypothetical protein